jgi:uncharacterized protein YuzE
MKLHYYPETDSLYIELKTAPGAETRERNPSSLRIGRYAEFSS